MKPIRSTSNTIFDIRNSSVKWGFLGQLTKKTTTQKQNF